MGIDVELDDIVDVNYTPQTTKNNPKQESSEFEPDKYKQGNIPNTSGEVENPQVVVEQQSDPIPIKINEPQISNDYKPNEEIGTIIEETPIENPPKTTWQQNNDPIPTETDKPQISNELKSEELEDTSLDNKKKNRETPDGWIDNYHSDTNHASCTIHYYNNQQYLELLRKSNAELERMLENNKTAQMSR